MPKPKIFNRWYRMNEEQIKMHYKNYIDDIVQQGLYEEIVDLKHFAFDMLLADTQDSINHKPTLLFDPIPIISGNIKTEEQLVNYIKHI